MPDRMGDIDVAEPENRPEVHRQGAWIARRWRDGRIAERRVEPAAKRDLIDVPVTRDVRRPRADIGAIDNEVLPELALNRRREADVVRPLNPVLMGPLVFGTGEVPVPPVR